MSNSSVTGGLYEMIMEVASTVTFTGNIAHDFSVLTNPRTMPYAETFGSGVTAIIKPEIHFFPSEDAGHGEHHMVSIKGRILWQIIEPREMGTVFEEFHEAMEQAVPGEKTIITSTGKELIRIQPVCATAGTVEDYEFHQGRAVEAGFSAMLNTSNRTARESSMAIQNAFRITSADPASVFPVVPCAAILDAQSASTYRLPTLGEAADAVIISRSEGAFMVALGGRAQVIGSGMDVGDHYLDYGEDSRMTSTEPNYGHVQRVLTVVDSRSIVIQLDPLQEI